MDEYKRESLDEIVAPFSMPTGDCRTIKRYRQENRGCTSNITRKSPRDQYGGQKEMQAKDRWSCEAYDNFPLAMAYVPWQKFRKLYEDEYESLRKGTIFKELYMPYVGRSCK